MKKLAFFIPTPCNEDWKNMEIREKGRFCSNCSKTVIDFTNMSDRDLVAFFEKNNSSVCGRFQDHQLNKDILLSGNNTSRVNYFFRFIIPAFLLSIKANAQRTGHKTEVITIQNNTTDGKVMYPGPNEVQDSQLIQGMVENENNEPVAGAMVVIKGTNIGTSTDASGKFKLPCNTGRTDKLVVSYVGYITKEVLASKSGINIKLNIYPAIMGKLRVVHQPKIRSLQKKLVHKIQRIKEITYNRLTDSINYKGSSIDKTIEKRNTSSGQCLQGTLGGVSVGVSRTYQLDSIPLIKYVKDTLVRKLSVYPNPAYSNTILNIRLKGIQKNEYLISLINMSGVIVKENKILITDCNEKINFHLNQIPAGTYFIRLTNLNSDNYSVQKVIVY